MPRELRGAYAHNSTSKSAFLLSVQRGCKRLRPLADACLRAAYTRESDSPDLA